MKFAVKLVKRGYSAFLLDVHNKKCKKHQRYYRTQIKILSKIVEYKRIKIGDILEDT